MSPTFLKRLGFGSAWGLVLAGTLSIASWPGDWGHGICGPWGCGPPLQAIVACHSSWIVALLPFSVWGISRLRPRLRTRIGLCLLLASLVGLLAVASHEWFTWRNCVSDWQRPYYWNRVGFVLSTLVDIPILQIFVMGGLFSFPWQVGSGEQSSVTRSTGCDDGDRSSGLGED